MRLVSQTSFQVSMLTTLSLLLGGCMTPEDRASRLIDQYGYASISSPILGEPKGGTGFHLNNTAQDYYDDAREDVQGASATTSERVNSFGAGLTARADLTQLAAGTAALTQYQAAARNIAAEQLGRQQLAAVQQEAARNLYAQQVQSLANIKDPVERAGKQFEFSKLLTSNSDTGTSTTLLPEFPTADPSKIPTLPTGIVPDVQGQRDVLMAKNFNEALKLIPEGIDPILSNREAILTAAGDHAVQSIFEILGDPARAGQYTNRRILFGASMVSVKPGWMTKESYEATVTTRVEYDYRIAGPLETLSLSQNRGGLPQDIANKLIVDALKKLGKEPHKEQGRLKIQKEVLLGKAEKQESKTSLGIVDITYDEGVANDQAVVADANVWRQEVRGSGPVVSAVSPMTTADVFDVSASMRRQTETALRLAAVLRYYGAEAAGEAFEKYVTRNQRDLRAINSQIYAMPTTGGQGSAGFVVGPRFYAQGDLTDNDQKPENLLVRQAFPALFVYGFNEKDLRYRVVEDDGEMKLAVPIVRQTTTFSWRPLEDRYTIEKFFYRLFTLNFERRPLSEEHRLHLYRDLALKIRAITDLKPNDEFLDFRVRDTRMKFWPLDRWVGRNPKDAYNTKDLGVDPTFLDPGAMATSRYRDIGEQLVGTVSTIDLPIGSGDGKNPGIIGVLTDNATQTVTVTKDKETTKAITIIGRDLDQVDPLGLTISPGTGVTTALKGVVNSKTPELAFVASVSIKASADGEFTIKVPVMSHGELTGETLEAKVAVKVEDAKPAAAPVKNPTPSGFTFYLDPNDVPIPQTITTVFEVDNLTDLQPVGIQPNQVKVAANNATVTAVTALGGDKLQVTLQVDKPSNPITLSFYNSKTQKWVLAEPIAIAIQRRLATIKSPMPASVSFPAPPKDGDLPMRVNVTFGVTDVKSLDLARTGDHVAFCSTGNATIESATAIGTDKLVVTMTIQNRATPVILQFYDEYHKTWVEAQPVQVK